MITRAVRHAVALSLFTLVAAACSAANPDRERTGLERTGSGASELMIGPIGIAPPPANNHSFGPLTYWGSEMTTNGTWGAANPRMAADVNGDGRSDLVGFSYYGVFTALSTGAGFAAGQLVSTQFGNNQAWDVSKHIRTTADLNNDGKADLIGFGDAGVWTQLSTGAGFAASRYVLAQYGLAQGWSVERDIRTFADVNGDRYLDIVGFNPGGIYVSLGDRSGGFGPALLASNQLVTNNGGWTTADHVRTLADVNNDGCADVIGFGYAGVWTALSTFCTGGTTFQPPTFVLAKFGYVDGWRVANHVRVLADVDQDRNVDIVAFGEGGVSVSKGTGNNAFAPPVAVLSEMAPDEGWHLPSNPRFVVDLNGDGWLDLLGYGNSAVYRVLGGPKGFGRMDAVAFDPIATGDLRLLGDVNGDHTTDLITVGAASDLVALSSTHGPPACPAAANQCSTFAGANDVRFYDMLLDRGVSGCSPPATLCTGATDARDAATIFYSACPNDANPVGPLRLGLESTADPSFDGLLPAVGDDLQSACLPSLPSNLVYVLWIQDKDIDPKHAAHPRCPSACLCPGDVCGGGGPI